ncbi:MAG TPA: competence protein CoiA family protein [Acidimicrobiales bacterium]|nr:competence protein CoiA family protein [Acidimicrobiales bacterium]
MEAAHREFFESRDETGQRWAWDRAAERLIRIDRGEADELRVRCRAGELVCPLENCARPALTTVRAHRRAKSFVDDGFRHRDRPPVPHRPESIAHVQGKLLVAEWLRQAGAVVVEIERRDTQAGRTPDVSAVLGDGQRIAIEVQYSGLTAKTWRDRDEALRAASFSTTWLFGVPTASTVEQPLHRGLQQVHREVLGSGARVWWLDVERAELAASGVDRTVNGDDFVAPVDDDPGLAVTCLWAAMTAHAIVNAVVVSPHDQRLAKGGKRWEAHLALMKLKELTEAEHPMNVESATREASERVQAARPSPREGLSVPAWNPRDVVAADVTAAVPSLAVTLSFSDPDDGAIEGDATVWHAEILLHFVVDRAYGNSFHFEDVRRFVLAHHRCEYGAGRAIWHFLEHLAAAGVLRGVRLNYGFGPLAPDPPTHDSKEPTLF